MQSIEVHNINTYKIQRNSIISINEHKRVRKNLKQRQLARNDN